MGRNIFWGRYRLSLFIIPKNLEILFDIFCICAFQVVCRSMISPRKFKSSTLTKYSPFNSNFVILLIIFRISHMVIRSKSKNQKWLFKSAKMKKIIFVIMLMTHKKFNMLCWKSRIIWFNAPTFIRLVIGKHKKASSYTIMRVIHGDVITRRRFPYHLPFVSGTTGHR